MLATRRSNTERFAFEKKKNTERFATNRTKPQPIAARRTLFVVITSIIPNDVGFVRPLLDAA